MEKTIALIEEKIKFLERKKVRVQREYKLEETYTVSRYLSGRLYEITELISDLQEILDSLKKEKV